MLQPDLQKLPIKTLVTLWSTKALKRQRRVSHPWRCARQHLSVASCTPAYCSDDALVDNDAEAPNMRLSPVEMHLSTPGGGLLYAGSVSTFKTQGVVHNIFLGASEKRSRGGIFVRQRARYSTCKTYSGLPKVTETKSRQSLLFDPGGWSGRLCSCPFWEGGARCFVGGLILEPFATRYSHLCFLSISCFEYISTGSTLVLPSLGQK